MIKWVAILLGVWNLVTFSLYGIDKAKAKRDAWRISEFTLLWCAFVMGGFGAIIGSKVFHHKTQKTKFKILLPLALFVNIIVLVAFGAWVTGLI